VVVVLLSCRREVEGLPGDIRGDLADALARLDAGLSLAMPLSRPMPSIGRGVHELRLKDRSGQYRVIYALGLRGFVHVLHAFKKTTRATPQRRIAVAQRRLQEVIA
jgi:phage-related protein